MFTSWDLTLFFRTELRSGIEVYAGYRSPEPVYWICSLAFRNLAEFVLIGCVEKYMPMVPIAGYLKWLLLIQLKIQRVHYPEIVLNLGYFAIDLHVSGYACE